jgi:transposase InsO family protein
MGAEKANYRVARMARLLGVSRSGFYAWARRMRQAVLSVAALRRGVLDREVLRIHGESYETYGAPRIRAALAGIGVAVDVKTVAASMRRQGLEGISPRKFKPVAPLGQGRVHSIPDLVERCWDTGALNAVWISDITYLRTQQGWVYLCAVRDGCSRRVIGWAMDSVQDTGLVIKALRMAMVLRQGSPAQAVFHADRGTRPVHLGPDARCVQGSRGETVRGPYRGLLGQCDAGVVLVNAQDRVLQPPHLANPPASHDGHRTLDRRVLQPAAAPLRTGLPQPARLRTQTQVRPTSDGKSRLTNRPRFADNLTSSER